MLEALYFFIPDFVHITADCHAADNHFANEGSGWSRKAFV